MISGIFPLQKNLNKLHNEFLSNKLHRNTKKYQMQLKLYFFKCMYLIVKRLKKKKKTPVSSDDFMVQTLGLMSTHYDISLSRSFTLQQ